MKSEVQSPKLMLGVWMFILECKSSGKEFVISGSSNTGLRPAKSNLSPIASMIPM